jgi:hypothetical protein
MHVSITVNGVAREAEVEPRTLSSTSSERALA